jgi:hybrid cluster-associated redox disulfide protein
MIIKKEMKIGEVLRGYPETVDVFVKYNLSCVGCPFSDPESIEEAAAIHKIDLDSFLKDLNNSLKNEKIK